MYSQVLGTLTKKKSDLQQERLRVVMPAADIIREDIHAKVYETTEYPPSDNFLHEVNSVIPESVQLLFYYLKV